jgi:hypothetical protein
MNSTFYILYKTTNLINGNIYIGIHQTNNLDDGYLGSGKNLLNAIKKYGKHNFYREILEFFIDEISMAEREIEIVTEDFCKRKDTYNIMPGGKWGSYQRNGLSFNGRHHTEESKIKISKSSIGRSHTKESKLLMSKNNFAKREPERQRECARLANLNKPKSDSHRKKISDSIKKINPGLKNLGKIRKKVKCPFCDKEGAMNTMSRFHFDNCKNQ